MGYEYRKHTKQDRLSVQDDVRLTTQRQNRNQNNKKNTAKNLKEPLPPKIDDTLEDPCTCGLYPRQSCLGKKPCPHE